MFMFFRRRSPKTGETSQQPAYFDQTTGYAHYATPPAPVSQTILPLQVSRPFPPSFKLHHTREWSTYLLGEQSTYPIYALKLRTNFSDDPDLTLHAGATPTGPVVGSLKVSRRRGDITVSLPPVAGMTSEILVSRGSHGWREAFRFAVEVGSGADMRMEEFEWRYSTGKVIETLDGDFTGWKLVRIETSPPLGWKGGFVPTSHITKDGKEVVASWADSEIHMKWMHEAVFALLGTGATGVLGERWSLMVVMSALGIWERERRTNQH